jgi:cell division protein FtsN
MAEKTSEVRELRLEGAGLFIIVAFLGAGLVGAFFLGRWFERSSAPPAELQSLASDPLKNVVAPAEVENVDVAAGAFDTIEGQTKAEPSREVTPPAVAKPLETTPPARQAQAPKETPSAESKGKFFVQIAAFRDRSSAEKVVGELEGAGYPVRVFSEDGASGQLYKVRVGGYATRDEAASIAAVLNTKGHAGAFPTEIP